MESFNMTNILKWDFCQSENFALCILLYFFLALLTTGTICGNLLVIISIIYFKQLHTPTNYLILSLAMADMLVGAIIFPFNMVLSVTTCWYNYTVQCKIQSGLDFIMSASSILNLCCISVDRYYAVCQPLMYNVKITDNVAVIMSAGSWAVSLLSGFVYVVIQLSYDLCIDVCFFTAGAISVVIFYFPTIILFCMYFNILIVAQRQSRSLHKTISQSGPAPSKRERKSTKTMSIVMGLFLLCWLPLFVLLPFRTLNNFITNLIEPFNWFALSNSFFNPFIYAFFYSWFRSAFRMIISGKIFQGDFANTKLL